MDINLIAALLIKRLDGTISAAEETELQAWMDESETNRNVLKRFDTENFLPEELGKLVAMKERVWGQLEEVIDGKTSNTKVVRVNWWKRIAVAASVILALSAIAYFLFPQDPKQPISFFSQEVKDVHAPASNRAMITLANGQVVYLDSAANGELTQQGNIKIVKLNNGQISYQPASGELIREVTFNTLHNPRGSKVIDMQLSDGSHVWLNAGSSVTYPVAFIGNERKVIINGEAYFEIAKDKTKPFIVSKGTTSVTVLGTHFNVNAYDDEQQIKVTLLEGSVKVSSQTANSFLVPGQQAQISSELKVVTANIEEVMAWKNGKFQFGEGASIEAIMREVSRWYDVEIEYKGTVSGHIGGSVPREVNASQLFRILAMTGTVKFEIEGKKVIVSAAK